MRKLVLAIFCGFLGCSGAFSEDQSRSAPDPLRVMLIPADGGIEDGTKADFAPLFAALSEATGLTFEIQTGQSYAAVIEGMCAGHADIAWFGPVSYKTARDRGCAELLAVETRNGSATYFSGLFVSSASDIRETADLAGGSIALGSMHSTSSFAYPLAMLKQAGIEPLDGLSTIRLTGSHANSLMMLGAGHVHAAGASFTSFERAVNQGNLSANAFRVIAKSDPIPNPPLAVYPGLDTETKTALREALSALHEMPGIRPSDIRGYGGKPVDRYDVTVDDETFDQAMAAIAFIDDAYKAEVLGKASEANPGRSSTTSRR
ncbi:MAG: phosphate/phosphite/phosphonate ABC transporter substrate-binding protein [Pseudomonadota bacterium]